MVSPASTVTLAGVEDGRRKLLVISPLPKPDPRAIAAEGKTVRSILVAGNKVTKDFIVLRELELAPGHPFKVATMKADVTRLDNLGIFSSVAITPEEDAHLSKLKAVVSVSRNGQQPGTLAPEKRFYKKPQQPTTEVAMRSTLSEDLYLVLGSYDPASGLVTLLAYVNPLVAWLWIGGLIMGLGTVVTMWPSAAERRAPAYALGGARVPAE